MCGGLNEKCPSSHLQRNTRNVGHPDPKTQPFILGIPQLPLLAAFSPSGLSELALTDMI